MFGRATITLGIGPHSSFVCFFVAKKLSLSRLHQSYLCFSESWPTSAVFHRTPFCQAYHSVVINDPPEYLTLYQPPHACALQAVHHRYEYLSERLCGAALEYGADVAINIHESSKVGVAKSVSSLRED